ncbi:MAG: hypothetical protein KDA58_06295 [Planctomycetaceae bacterium]|nr:hypothetical protein [Planctomycetaceae bacterium]
MNTLRIASLFMMSSLVIALGCEAQQSTAPAGSTEPVAEQSSTVVESATNEAAPT